MLFIFRKYSLKKLILLPSLGTIVLIWLAVMLLTYFDTRHELDEVLDAHLAQASTLLIPQLLHREDNTVIDLYDFDQQLDRAEAASVFLEDEDDDNENSKAYQEKYINRLAFQVMRQDTSMLVRSANAPATAFAHSQPGFSNTYINGQNWRVFTLFDQQEQLVIHTAEATRIREELALEITFNVLVPLTLALPLLILLIWLIITLGLRSLSSLTNMVEKRNPHNLTPIDITAPSEVMPLVERLNGLFVRTGKLIDNERRFTADAAHELRTPVASIKAQLQVAQSSTSQQQAADACTQAIRACDNLAHVLNQLLTLARIEHTQMLSMQNTDLHALVVKEVSEIAAMAVVRDIDLRVEKETAHTFIQANAAMLAILVRNLLDNAIKHSTQGSRIEVLVATKQDQTCLTVRDNGQKLNADEVKKFVGRFYRPAGTRASGSGLGLSIVKRIVQVHQATLHLQPNPQGAGLEISVCFSG